MIEKPLILVCNDDGINAPGLKALVDAVRPLGEIVVVAPDSPQSGMGHAVTIGSPLRMTEMHGIFEGIKSYQVSGTPVDCVKLAVDKVFHRKPDLLVSGINHGSNSSINVIYSGTMSAAVEGAIEGIPSIGFSLCDYSFNADFSLAKKIAYTLAKKTLENPMEGLLLNVNIPLIAEKNFKGIKVCRQAKAKWVENFEERLDPHGKKYYWLTGDFQLFDMEIEQTDEHALRNNFVSVVPVQFDMTNYRLIDALKNWDLNEN